jgi:hypothetical protein
MGGILGLKRNRGVARLAVNLLGANGAMTVDTNADGVVDGFTEQHTATSVPVFVLDDGQKITMADATTAAHADVYTALIAVSPNTPYALSIDSKIARSAVETVRLSIGWYTAADAVISSSTLSGLNPGTTYSRQTLTATSPATAAKARLTLRMDTAIGDTGSAWFKDALLQAA